MLKMIQILLAVTIGATLYSSPTFAQKKDKVDLLLVLAADVSRSVNFEKFNLQRGGYAQAITDRRVLAAISSGHHRKIAVMYMEWAGKGEQRVIVDWTIVRDLASAKIVAQQLHEAPRAFAGKTAIGDAINEAAKAIEVAPFDSERCVIDVSADGTSNDGVAVEVARDKVAYAGCTINALVVLTPDASVFLHQHTNPPGGLENYFKENVIGGMGSFTIVADGFRSFADAIVKKMVAEIALLDTQ